MDELMKQNGPETALTVDDQTTAVIVATVREILSPIMQSMAQFIANNTEAMNRMASQQKIQSDRMEELERLVRLGTPVTPTQVRHINEAIRKRSRELLMKKNLEEDKKAVSALSSAIRKDILSRYGVAALHEVPRYEYNVVLQQVSTWSDVLAILDVSKAARKRKNAEEGKK